MADTEEEPAVVDGPGRVDQLEQKIKRLQRGHAEQMRNTRLRCAEAAVTLMKLIGEQDVSTEMALGEAEKLWEWVTHWHRPDPEPTGE